MSSQNKTETSEQHPLSAILGAVEITVSLRNGAQEKVKVRQLPIRLLGDWSNLLNDEASLVELYCDKIDRERDAKLLKLGGEALALHQKLQQGLSGEDLEKVSNELAMTRAEIAKLNEHRWDDELTPEAHDEIVRIGYDLNRPRFDRWLQNRQNAIGHLKEVYAKYLPDHPLVAKPNAPDSTLRTGSEPSSPTSQQSPAGATAK